MKKAPEAPVEVLITGGNLRSGLTVARSLSHHGVSFIVLAEERHSLAFYSRHVKHVLVSPSPTNDPEAFLKFTLESVQKYQVQLVIPTTDSILLLLDKNRRAFPEQTKLAMASSEALRSVLDKRLNLEIAKKIGIPCPRQFDMESLDQVPQMIEKLHLPIVLKPPGYSLDEIVPSFNFKVLYAKSEAQLRQYIDEHCSNGHFPLFQECALGEVHNLCCFAACGETLSVHEYISIRRKGGEGALRQCITPSPELVKYARKMLQELAWDGVAQVAFFVSRDQGKVWYMETNGRFWGSTEGSVHAGWDFPHWVYRYFLYGEKPEPGPLQIGSRTCWHRGDLEALIGYMRGGESPTTGKQPGKLRAIIQYLSGFSPMNHSDVFRLSDPLPAVLDHYQLFKSLFDAWSNRADSLSDRPQ